MRLLAGDGRALSIDGVLALASVMPVGIALSTDGRQLYFSESSSNRLRVVELFDGQVLQPQIVAACSCIAADLFSNVMDAPVFFFGFDLALRASTDASGAMAIRCEHSLAHPTVVATLMASQ